MRKETTTKARKTVATAPLERYHSSQSSLVNYAFQGFKRNAYFTSDRAKPLDEQFRLADGTPLKGYGLEIELESKCVNSDQALAFTLKHLAFEQLPDDLFKFQHDGSLGNFGALGSAEAITQVMTKEFIRNNLPGFRYMYDVFGVYGVGATLTGNCGMHVNMSVGLFGATAEKQKEAIMKLAYFVNRSPEAYIMACHLFRRNTNATRYCSRMTRFSSIDACKSYDPASLNESSSDHGVSFNLAHFNTGRVELRLVGGQPDYFAFRNTMEVIFHLVDAVKRLSWADMDNPRKVFKGCNKYVLKRLLDCAGYGDISVHTYDEIVAASDTETDFGNF